MARPLVPNVPIRSPFFEDRVPDDPSGIKPLSLDWLVWLQSQADQFKKTVSVNTVNWRGSQGVYGAQPFDSILVVTDVAGRVNLPPVAANPEVTITVMKVSGDGNALVVGVNGYDKINGLATWSTTAQYGKATFHNDGASNWYVMA